MTHTLVQDAVIRNAVAHGYFKVDFEIVWTTLQAELPALLAQVQALLAGLDRPAGAPAPG